MNPPFLEKRVLITGSSKGIGLATAHAFLSQGANVVIHGRTKESVDKALNNLPEGTKFSSCSGDLANVETCVKVVSTAIESLGGLDILVNSAGRFALKSIEDSYPSYWDEIMNINVRGTYYTSRASLTALRASRGCIVNLASVAGLQGYSQQTVYCASKGAIVNMTRAMAMELAPEIRVNCVCPGIVDTDMTRRAYAFGSQPGDGELEKLGNWNPLKRIGTVEDVTNAIVFLCAKSSHFITGISLPVEGGSTAGI